METGFLRPVRGQNPRRENAQSAPHLLRLLEEILLRMPIPPLRDRHSPRSSRVSRQESFCPCLPSLHHSNVSSSTRPKIPSGETKLRESPALPLVTSDTQIDLVPHPEMIDLPPLSIDISKCEDRRIISNVRRSSWGEEEAERASGADHRNRCTDTSISTVITASWSKIPHCVSSVRVASYVDITNCFVAIVVNLYLPAPAIFDAWIQLLRAIAHDSQHCYPLRLGLGSLVRQSHEFLLL